MEPTSHQNGPHSGETAERQTLFEIQAAIKSMPATKQHEIDMLATNFRRIVHEDSTGMAQLAFALVGAEMAAR